MGAFKEEMGALKAQVVHLNNDLVAANGKVVALDSGYSALQGEFTQYQLKTNTTIEVCACFDPFRVAKSVRNTGSLSCSSAVRA